MPPNSKNKEQLKLSSQSSESAIDHSAIKDATDSTKRLVGLQIFSRVISLILNTVLVRRTSPLILGITTVKLELFLNTILYLAREGLRMSLLRFTPPAPLSSTTGSRMSEMHYIRWLRKLIHMAWLAIPSALLPLIGMFLAYAWTLPPEIKSLKMTRWYWMSIGTYALAALLELLGEPLRMIITHSKLQSKRVRLEALVLSFKTVIIFTLFLSLNEENMLRTALIAFSVAQLLNSIMLVGGYYYLICQVLPTFRIIDFLPFPAIEVEESILHHAIDMTKHIILGYLLSQGDMWIISLVAPLTDQGVYVLVTNYGSLLARIFFQPIEESGLSFFSQQPPSLSLYFLSLLLRLYGLLGLGLGSVGMALARPFVGTVLGEAWLSSHAPLALQVYCLLLPVMAISGILESFVNGTTTKEWIYLQRVISILTTIVYVTVAIISTKMWGPVGLISAKIVNFGLRASFSFYYVCKFATIRNLRWPHGEMFPHRITIMTFAILVILLYFLKVIDSNSMFDKPVLTVVLILPMVLIVLRLFEQETINALLGRVPQRPSPVTKSKKN